MSQSMNGTYVVRVLVVGQALSATADLNADPGGRAVKIIGSCATGRDALRSLRDLKPDVLLASWDLPDIDCLSLLRQLRKRHDVRTILLARELPTRDLTEAVSLGAAGALDPRAGEGILVKCIRAVAAGEYWFRRGLTRALLELLPEDGARSGRTSLTSATRRLTRRETDVMEGVARGKTNREIAQELKLSEHTVKQHLKQVFGKLRVSSRVELVLHLARASR